MYLLPTENEDSNTAPINSDNKIQRVKYMFRLVRNLPPKHPYKRNTKLP